MSFFARLGGSDSSDSGSDSEESLMSGDEKPQQRSSMFARGGDDSDSDSDSDSEEESLIDSDEESDDDSGGLANKFLKDAVDSDEDSDDEDKIRVMSAKDKRFAEMDAAISSIQNATKAGGAAGDWVAASNELDKLIRFITRHQTLMLSSPIPPAGHIPPPFLATIVELDESVNATLKADKSAAKKMPGNKSKALNSMRQTLKKKTKEFELVLTEYKKDPEAYAAAYAKANVPPKVERVKASREAGEGAEEDDADFKTIGKGGRQLNLTAEGILRTLRDIFEQRGRKNTDRAETIRILSKLLEVSETTYQKIRVLLALISARLDYSTNLVSIPHDSWVLCLQEYDQLISLLLANKDYIVQDNVEEYDDMEERTPAGGRVAVAGNLVGLLENLDNEFTKTLQHTDAHERGTEYIARLREETPLYVAIAKAQALFEREQWNDQIARAIMRRLEHVYAKPDVIIDHFEAAVNKVAAAEKLESKITPFGVERDASGLVHLLCVHIYHSDAPLLRARAILAHIFNHAMHARYHQARDLMLMSHLHDTIQHADVATQIMYNRAVMQLGIAAFRNGYIQECQTVLGDMFAGARTKELLAQAIQRFDKAHQLTPEQELIEKRRLLPFHMHLNIELLEAAYLTSCMLLEIPLLAATDSEEQKKRFSSRPFKRYLDNAEKNAFMGPPDNTRDYIIKASKSLEAGEWERARDLIDSIKIWQLLDNADDVRTMLARKIQEEGLRTYLFTYASHYASVSLSHLADMFSLPQSTVTSIISRMIYTDEIVASLDQIDQVLVFHRVEQSEVQRLAQQLAERCVTMVEQNEKALDVKLGQGQGGGDRTGPREAEGGRGARQERRGGARGRGGRGGFGGRGRGFNSGLGSQRRVAA